MGNTSHGPQMDRWTPSGAGFRLSELSPILAPLEAHKKYVAWFGNLENRAMIGGVGSLGAGDLAERWAQERGQPRASMSTTLDQVVAKNIGQNTTLPSLDFAAETTQQAAACSGSACFYNTTLAFSETRTHRCRWSTTPARCSRRCSGKGTRRRSGPRFPARPGACWTALRNHTSALQRNLGASRNRVVLDNYLETLREIERRVQLASSRDLSAIDVPEAPIGELSAFGCAGRSAVRSDCARLPGGFDARGLLHHGGRGHQPHLQPHRRVRFFHPVSHHANDLSRLEKLARFRPGTWIGSPPS